MSLAFGVLNQFASVFWTQSHHDVEEVGPVYLPSFRELIRHILPKLWILDHLRPEILYTEFIVERNIDPLDSL